MKKIAALIAALLLSACAFGTAEAGQPALSFEQSLNSIPSAAAERAAKDKTPSIKPERLNNIQVAGQLRLFGTGTVPPNGGYVYATLTGRAYFRDMTGEITSFSVPFTHHASVFVIPGMPVTYDARIQRSVPFYKGGKFVGNALMTGTVRVKGFPDSGGNVVLDGADILRGTIR